MGIQLQRKEAHVEELLQQVQVAVRAGRLDPVVLAEVLVLEKKALVPAVPVAAKAEVLMTAALPEQETAAAALVT